MCTKYILSISLFDKQQKKFLSVSIIVKLTILFLLDHTRFIKYDMDQVNRQRKENFVDNSNLINNKGQYEMTYDIYNCYTTRYIPFFLN